MAAGFTTLIGTLAISLSTTALFAAPAISSPTPAAPAASAPAASPGTGTPSPAATSSAGLTARKAGRPAAKPRPLTAAEGIAAANKLDGTATTWAGDAQNQIVAVQPYHGKVLVLAKGKVTTLAGRVPAANRAQTEVVQGGIVSAATSPLADTLPWSAGNSITNTMSACTLGWPWVRWDTGKVVGSTAAHCGAGVWYHNGRKLGTVSKTGSGFLKNDVEFLTPVNGYPFARDVWIRGNDGKPVLRPIQDSGPNKVGGAIAFYGRTSGGGVGRIVNTAFNGTPGVILSTLTQGRPGDSGGPVFVTHLGGAVQARGTVAALTYADNNANGAYDNADSVTGLIYTDVTYTSREMKATLYTLSYKKR